MKYMNFNLQIKNTLISYFVALGCIWLLAGYLLWQKGYNNSFLFLNAHYNEFFDKVMPHLTQLGDSLILTSLILLIFIRKDLPLTLTAILSILSSGIVLIFLKQVIFNDWHRPLTVLKENNDIHFITGYVEYFRSFPSGHSTTIGSAFPVIAVFFRKKSYIAAVFFAFLSALLSYTRVYLGSHFLGDILAGSMLGSLFAILSILFLLPKLRAYFLSKNESLWERIISLGFLIGIAGLIAGMIARYLII